VIDPACRLQQGTLMTGGSEMEAMFAVHSGGRLLVGRNRIAILDAIARCGSVTRAAKETGYSYKATWDAVAAINNLLPRPGVLTQIGGPGGGGAKVTDEGMALIGAFRALEAKLTDLTALIHEQGFGDQADMQFWAKFLKTSARNHFHCQVTHLDIGQINSMVRLDVHGTQTIVANITTDSVNELALGPGRRVTALIKPSFVRLMPVGSKDVPPLANRITGTISHMCSDGTDIETRIALADGGTLISVCKQEHVSGFGFYEGHQVLAIFDPDHILLVAE
jgi:molybdate transport system regulatory protein